MKVTLALGFLGNKSAMGLINNSWRRLSLLVALGALGLKDTSIPRKAAPLAPIELRLVVTSSSKVVFSFFHSGLRSALRKVNSPVGLIQLEIFQLVV